MILGNSAFIYRKSGTSEYFSKNLINNIDVDRVRIDIKYVNGEDEVDIDGLKKEDKDFPCLKFSGQEKK